MQVELDRRHRIAAPPGAAWALLRDVREVTSCMPGAAITEQTDEGQFRGAVSVRVGPVQSAFTGTLGVTALDEADRSLGLSAKGRDRTGSSNASMELTAAIVAVDGGCELVGRAQIKVLGRMANVGARVIDGVADQIIGQFLTNFSDRVIAASGEGASAEAAAARVAEQPRALNPLGLLWGAIRSFFRRLLGGDPRDQ